MLNFSLSTVIPGRTKKIFFSFKKWYIIQKSKAETRYALSFCPLWPQAHNFLITNAIIWFGSVFFEETLNLLFFIWIYFIPLLLARNWRNKRLSLPSEVLRKMLYWVTSPAFLPINLTRTLDAIRIQLLHQHELM